MHDSKPPVSDGEGQARDYESQDAAKIPPFRTGDVVRYTPAERFDRWWCREGTAIARSRPDGTVVLADTYWGGGSDAHILTADEITTATLVFNLDDYDMLDEYGRGSRDRWLKYAPEDREVVTSQHRLQARYYIRKGATESLETQIDNAREALAEAIRERDMAQWRVECRERELDELKARASAGRR